MQLKRLGPYEIDKPLGKGGMGSVYAATDTQTAQRVAIKALTPHLAMAEGFRERFEAEIESLKTLRHKGIVRLFGYGEQDGVLFYSMELVEGISLEDELKAGRRFNWREVTSIAIQLSLALKHAHDHGIIHRDIKPANILLFDEDRVKLADFGIARLFGTTQLTTAGGVLGTADYMSPEQAEGRPVTTRCDQYSLGGVMYALLAGRPPFVAKNLPQMLQLQRFASPEPVRRYAPDTPEQLERVIMQLLAKEPAHRFPNTQVLARHLQALVRALSRPSADDFALPADEHAADHLKADRDQSLAVELTQGESDRSSPQPGGASIEANEPKRIMTTEDAATVGAEEETPIRQTPGGRTANAAASAIDGAVKAAPLRPAHFTTLEEERARLRAEHRRPWLLIAAQLAILLTVLGGLGAAAIYLSRPPSADELYQEISTRIERDDDISLGDVVNELDQFLRQYPNDPRAAEIQRYKQRTDLDKRERRLHRQARGGEAIDPELLPVEQLYLQAVRTAENEPDQAIAMLQSLVDLYAPATANGQDAQVAAVVQLASRRLSDMQVELTKHREQQLKSLQERINAAGRLTANEPQQAAAMYRAIIDLHERDAWAEEIVDRARSRLAELEKK
ncbi:MAG: protein kinase [Pirellulales bacterium]